MQLCTLAEESVLYAVAYSGTSLLLGQKKCPYFRVEKYTNMVLGEEESVLIREVSLFQVEKYTNMVFGEEESVLIREVSLLQGLKSTQTWYLGRKKVS